MSDTRRLALRSLAASLWFALMFFVAIPALVLWASGSFAWPRPGTGLWLGAALVVLAHVLLVPQVAVFVREGRGTHAPFDPPRQLVASGWYARVRNPMYLLYVGVIAGEALAFRSPALGLYAAGFWLMAHAYVVGVEERTLRVRFGPRYEAYCRSVPRWLPRRGRRM